MNLLVTSIVILGTVLPVRTAQQPGLGKGATQAPETALGGSSTLGTDVGTGASPGPRPDFWLSPGFPPPTWNYPYLPPGGPYLTTDYPFAGWPGYRGAYGNVLPLGPSKHRPAVPVYAPLPMTTDLEVPGKHGHARRTLGFGLFHYGWVGPFAASPRPKPLSVSIYAQDDPRCGLKHLKYPKGNAVAQELVPGPSSEVPPPGQVLALQVKMPQADAELIVDGVKTKQTGLDRLFESPPLQGTGEYQYELTARWTENGKPVERKKVVTGKPGDTVRVDLTTE